MSRWILVVCAAALAAPVIASEEWVEFGPVLERRELIAAVVARNPRVAMAEHVAEAAAARVERSSELDDPTATYEIAPLSIGSSQVRFGQGLRVAQRLPYPGTLRLRGAVAEADKAAALDDRDDVRLDLGLLASHLYDRYWLIDRALAVTADHIALLDAFQAVATARYAAGVASQQAPLQAETEGAHLLHQQVVLASERRQLTARLNALLHREPGASLPPAPAQPLPGRKVVPALGELARVALENRPDISAHRHAAAARRQAVALERLAYRPDFEPMASYNSMWRETEHQWMIGVGLRVPFHRKRIAAAVAEAEARLGEAESALDALVDDIRADIAVAHAEAEEAHHVVELYQDRVLPAARDQISAARAGFETGEVTMLALIDAERSLRSAELNRLEATADLNTALATLDRALGRQPFTSTPGRAAPSAPDETGASR